MAGNNFTAASSFDFFVLTADANRDRVVNTTDFNVLAANFGQSGRSFTQGNFDYSADGRVDTTDFNLLASRFGTSVAPAAPARVPAASIPQAFSQRLVDDIIG